MKYEVFLFHRDVTAFFILNIYFKCSHDSLQHHVVLTSSDPVRPWSGLRAKKTFWSQTAARFKSLHDAFSRSPAASLMRKMVASLVCACETYSQQRLAYKLVWLRPQFVLKIHPNVPKRSLISTLALFGLTDNLWFVKAVTISWRLNVLLPYCRLPSAQSLC